VQKLQGAYSDGNPQTLEQSFIDIMIESSNDYLKKYRKLYYEMVKLYKMVNQGISKY